MALSDKKLAAFDAGAGSRGVTYARDNPHAVGTELHAAWEQGWQHADRELTAASLPKSPSAGEEA